MTLRIFEVSADGVAVAVPKDKTDREVPPQSAAVAAPAAPPVPTGPERWAGSNEWDKLRSRLRETEQPRPEPRRRR
jgi:hypothetical protein